MYKKSMELLLPAVLGLGMSLHSVFAQASELEEFRWWSPSGFTVGTVKITLTGACKGNITLDAGSVFASASPEIDSDGNLLFGYPLDASGWSAGDGYGFSRYSSVLSAGEKFVETVKGSVVKQTLKFVGGSNMDFYIPALKDERFEGVLRCTDGKSFRQSDYLAAIDYGSSALSHKTTMSFEFDGSKPPHQRNAKAVLSQQMTADLLAESQQCTTKGSMKKSTLTCQSMKPVRIKVVFKAVGNAHAAPE